MLHPKLGQRRITEQRTDGGGHTALLRAMRFVYQEGHAQILEPFVIRDLVENVAKLLLGGNDNLLAVAEETAKVAGMLGIAHHVLEMREFFHVLTDVLVERLPVGKQENHVHHLFRCARFVEAVQVGQPASTWSTSCQNRRSD